MPEHHFEIKTTAGDIRGMIHTPITGTVKAVVIIVHGYFSANRVGPNRLYVLLARILSKNGFVVIRADFLGAGESDGDFKSISLEGEMRDLHVICNYASSKFGGVPVILCGHSMGANIAIRITVERNDIARLVLIAPDIQMRDGIDSLFSDEQREELRSQGWTLRKGLHINASFIDEIRLENALEIVRKVSVPIVVVQGDRDELYSIEGARRLAGNASRGSFYLIENGDHNFLLPTAQCKVLNLITNLLANNNP